MYDDDAIITYLVDFMIENGTQETSSGNWNFYFDELADKLYEEFGMSIEEAFEWLSENYRAIADEIDSRREVISETWFNYDEDDIVEGFDINFGLAYCPNAE